MTTVRVTEYRIIGLDEQLIDRWVEAVTDDVQPLAKVQSPNIWFAQHDRMLTPPWRIERRVRPGDWEHYDDSDAATARWAQWRDGPKPQQSSNIAVSPADRLVEFLRARLHEDEQIAGLASPGPWHLSAERDEVWAVDDELVADAHALSSNQTRATAAHIARWNPTRALAEVAAKRAIVDLYQYAAAAHALDGNLVHLGEKATAEAALQYLALPYAEHLDYDERWRPE